MRAPANLGWAAAGLLAWCVAVAYRAGRLLLPLVLAAALVWSIDALTSVGPWALALPLLVAGAWLVAQLQLGRRP